MNWEFLAKMKAKILNENKMAKITVNFTIEINDTEVMDFENHLRELVKVLDLRFLPDTKELYENDEHFRNLDKIYRKAKKQKNDYINKKL